MKLDEIMEVSANPFDYVAVNLEGKLITTSIMIAEYFGKNHKEVLRDIKEKVIPGVSAEFTERNFALSSYVDSTGRTLPMYELTRDGFTMVAMGYTGAKAMEFKEAYIKAFNKMEDSLNKKNASLSYRVEMVTEHILTKRFDKLEKEIKQLLQNEVRQLK